MDLLRMQGWFYGIGGLWPLVHFRSFEAVVGPKPDRLQTEVTAALFAAVGAALLAGTAEDRSSRPVRLLATAGGRDGVRGLAAPAELRPLFLAEAALEGLFVIGALSGRRERRTR
jgi:hypothetical protein